MRRVGVHLIYGSNPEPFLEACLRSLNWADYVCAVNTDPTNEVAQQNEAVVCRVVPPEKLRHAYLHMDEFSFGLARNTALDLADVGDWVIRVDSDEVHYPELQQEIARLDECGCDLVTGHFYHLILYKNMLGEEHPREFLFIKKEGTHFPAGVHEQVVQPGAVPSQTTYKWVHYGYVKPPREIFGRWQLYAEIEGEPARYEGRDPDRILDGWLDHCAPFDREHPPAVQPLLESYPAAPRSTLGETTRNVGLVLTTWNDAQLLRRMLPTLANTRQPFKLCVVDNGSMDGSLDLIERWAAEHDIPTNLIVVNTYLHLAQALNRGFEYFMKDPDIDYIGWIHPDMIFDYNTWLECLRNCLDEHPDIAKVGAQPVSEAKHNEPTPGNSQCYLIRKTALEQVGLFNERFLKCGGYEDWEHNFRLLKVGRVMVWPQAKIEHFSMSTRKRHDNVEAAHHNNYVYWQLTGLWDAAV